MDGNQIKKIPFWETVGRSFKYVLKNRSLLKTCALVALCLTIFQAALGMPILCSIDNELCQTGFKNALNVLIMALTSVAIIINYCRTIILKADIDFISLSFWKRMILYIFASICLSLLISFPTILVLTLFIIIKMPVAVMYSLVFLFIFGFSILLAPIFLVFPAISVDNRELRKYSKVYELVKGNKTAVFFGQFVLMMPYWILISMLTLFYVNFGSGLYVSKLILCAIIVILAVLDAALKGAYFAHIYQFFTFYDKKRTK